MWGEWILGLCLGGLLGLSAVSDVRTRQVSDWYSVAVFINGTLFAAVRTLHAASGMTGLVLGMHVTGGLVSFLILGVPAFMKKGVGGADVKLSAGLGIFWGIPAVLEVLLLSFIMSVFTWIVCRRLRRSNADSLPLVPFLTVGHFLFWLVGIALSG